MLVNAPAATETVTYLHSDTLGNVIGESKADGSFTRYHYKPYGERVESAPERLGFTAHLHQKELGLTYMQARHFDPLMGRFYGNDPVGFTPDNVFSFNRYGYGNNNPYRYVDPDGRLGVLAGFAAKFAGETALNATLNKVETGEFRLGDAATDAAKNLVNPASMVKNTVKVIRIAKAVHKIKISDQQQNAHVKGTLENQRRVENGKPTSTFDDRSTADKLTADTVATGERRVDSAGTTTYKKEYGERIGTNADGSDATAVKVHQKADGTCHGHPCN